MTERRDRPVLPTDEVLLPGDHIPEQTHVPTAVQLFRYSAVTWNAHRIHYDPSYARTEGYPDVLVQSHLHGAFLTQLCTDWLRKNGFIRRLSVSVRRFAVPGDVLVCRATITEVTGDPPTGGTRVELDLEELRPADAAVCASGRAELVLVPGTPLPVPAPLRPTVDPGKETT